MEEKKQKSKNFWNNTKTIKGKALSIWLIVIILSFMLIIFGLGMYLGKKIAEPKKENNTDDNITNEVVENPIFVNITNELLGNIEQTDSNIRAVIIDGLIGELYINDNQVFNNSTTSLVEVSLVYKIDNNYLVFANGTDNRTTHAYLYDSNGTTLQEIHSLDYNNMVFGDISYLKDQPGDSNIIEVIGTRLTNGSALVYGNPNDNPLSLCDENEIAKANQTDDYIVEARYQLVYDENKIGINIIPGTELTLGAAKSQNCNG